MATKRRPYARLLDSFWREPWPVRAKLAVANLNAYLHERWRTDQLDADTMFPRPIGWREAALIFGGNSRAATLQGVQQVGCCITCSWTATQEHLAFSWPKWLIEHELTARPTPGQRPANAPPHPHPRTAYKEEEKRETQAPEKAWLNVLSKEQGTDVEKAEFLAAELDRIEAEALASLPPDRRDKRALSAKTRSLIIGWYRQRRRNPNGPTRSGPSNGRRLTAVEAGQRIAADIEARFARAEPDLREDVHALPAVRDPRH